MVQLYATCFDMTSSRVLCFPLGILYFPLVIAETNRKKSKISKFLGMVRDALGGIGGSSLSIFMGFLKNLEKSNFRKLKIGQHRFKMG